MGFDPYNYSLKIRKSTESPTPKVKLLRSVKVHSLTLFCTPRGMRCDFWASLLACTLPNLNLGHEPKVRVATCKVGPLVA